MLRIPIFTVLMIAAAFAQAKPAGTPSDTSASPKLNVIKEVPVIYPEEALVKGIKGQVVLRVVISEAGDVLDASVISGEEIFQKAALDAVRQWKFEPYLESGKAIPVQTKIPINFGRRIRAGASVSKARLIHRVDPVFPGLAKYSHMQGTVVLHAVIGKDGRIVYLQFVSGNKVFEDSTVEAVKRWRYKPFLVDGEPVETDTIIEVNYSLSY